MNTTHINNKHNKFIFLILTLLATPMIGNAQETQPLSYFSSDTVLSTITVAGTVTGIDDESVDKYDKNDNLVSSETRLTRSKITNKTILSQMEEDGAIPTTSGYSLVFVDGYCYAAKNNELTDVSFVLETGDGVYDSSERYTYDSDDNETSACYKYSGFKSAYFEYEAIESNGLASFASTSKTSTVDGDPYLWDAETFIAPITGTDDLSYAFVGTIKSTSPKLVSELLP